MRQFQYETPQGFTADCLYPEDPGEQPDFVSHMDIPGQVVLRYEANIHDPGTGVTERRYIEEVRDFVPKDWKFVGDTPDDLPAQCRVTGQPKPPEPKFDSDPLLNEKRTINPKIKASDSFGPRDELGARMALPTDPNVEHVTDGTPCWCDPEVIHVEGEQPSADPADPKAIVAALDKDAKETPPGVEGGKGGWFTYGDPDEAFGFKVQGYDKMIHAWVAAKQAEAEGVTA